MADRTATRFLPPADADIVRATDLGSVQTLKHGPHYLLTDPFGDIHPDSRGLGLYRGDTRILSSAVLRVGGQRPVLLSAGVGANYRGTIQMTNPSLDRNPAAKTERTVPAQPAPGGATGTDRAEPAEAQPEPFDGLVGRTLGISRDRRLGTDGVQERIDIVNHGAAPLTIPVELDLGCDAADIFEVRGYPRTGRGRLGPIAVREDRATFPYDGLDGVRRSTHIAWSAPPTSVVAEAPDAPSGGSIRATWTITLEPGATRSVGWTVWASERPAPADEAGAVDEALFPPVPSVPADEGAAAYDAWAAAGSSVASDHELFNLVLRRSIADLRLLYNEGPDPGEHYVAAGVPWFSTLFGRDALITAYEALAFRPQLAVETLNVLAAHQATEVDDWRDAEPGKILHELRSGEMAGAGEIPHTPYYGSVDSTPLWLILLAATFDWTGDRTMLERLWPNALAALDWIDRYGDRDGDGFIEYERRSARGLLNQGWKDSSDSIRDRAGVEAVPPIALAEVQGYVYDAWRRIAPLARLRGNDRLASRLEAQADALRQRFEEAFWIPDQRYYAIALDADRRPADAIGSNAGQCLWSGIVAPERAAAVVDRLLGPSMFSGWGIRTYAADQPGYNPIGYHTGTVWPHDTALIAAGLKRYGFDDGSNRLVGRVLEAAQQFADYRLPELFCGFDREETSAPVPYPVACSPQAWAAGAPYLFLTTMLGMHAHADRAELELVHPSLPEWLTKVTIHGLRIGDATVDLLFHRWRGATSAEVLRKTGDLSVTIRL
ncbi:MAG: glycogen debranching N-terminal domain-containing protein [Candidatus Limnocylindria bacterium]